MQISERDFARTVILGLLVSANLLLYVSWPWLKSLPLISDANEPYSIRNALRNELYIGWLFNSIASRERILFLGTSESNNPHNLAAQLNQIAPENPRMLLVAKGGLSPIHSAVLVAKWKREGVSIPPLVLAINPVYFTRAYDSINDGWLSTVVRSPVFLQVNHRQVREYLSQEVSAAYDRHFRWKKLIWPATIQEYVGNLIYLLFHQASDSNWARQFHAPVYRFNGELPQYDERRNVWQNRTAADRFDSSRWSVLRPEESLTLKGLASTVANLQDERAPVFLLVLPVNRKFYEYHGVEMADFYNKYSAIRKKIKELSTAGANIYFLDLFDTPTPDRGFEDRMHLDQYGTYQLARFIVKTAEYLRFTDAVREHYNGKDIVEVGGASARLDSQAHTQDAASRHGRIR
jgi:hypothetical protein